MNLRQALAKLAAQPNGCWLWQGNLNNDGYGRVWYEGREHKAHRLIWQQMRGPIPENLQLDHLCRVRACCNPQHIEAVTQRENLLRGEGVGARNARKTACANGHPYDHREPDGSRRCTKCRSDYMKSRYQAAKAQVR